MPQRQAWDRPPAIVKVQRIVFDVTYTRMQHGSVGITRTVRRLGAALSNAAPALGFDFVHAAFHPSGFRSVSALSQSLPCGTPPGLLMKTAKGSAKPFIEAVLDLPWSRIGWLWAYASSLTFGRPVADAPHVEFRPGDILLLFDASWNYPVWQLAQQARAQGAQVVPLIHDLMPINAPHFCVPWVRNAFAYWLRQSITGSDFILCNSASTESELRSHAKSQGLALPPASHIRLGMDFGAVASGPIRSDLHRFIDVGPFYSTVGTLEPKKNHQLLLDAFERLWDADLPHRLLVLGRETSECAALARRLERLARAHGKVCWISDATDAELAAALSASQAVVLTSLFEGFGLPLVEARSLGRPVIATDLPAFRELADDGVCLFPASSSEQLAALIQAHAAGDLRLSCEPMRPFTWEDTARQCFDQFSRMTGAPANGIHMSPFAT